MDIFGLFMVTKKDDSFMNISRKSDVNSLQYGKDLKSMPAGP